MRCARILEVAPLGQIIQFESDRCSVDAPSVNKLGRFLCAERLVSINILRHQMLFVEEEVIFDDHFTCLVS